VRGTSNSNARGSSYTRRARRRWLVATYQADEGEGFCRCFRCGQLLTVDTVTIDRIVPGCLGGKYVRNNIRPACGRCNSEHGGALRGAKA
jgi:hypothetical protein